MRNTATRDSWPLIIGKLEFRYPELSKKDLDFKEQEEEQELMEKIEGITGKSWKQLMLEINTLLLDE
ncbi:MAG: hypothetical protein P1P88_00215 [Bacteroidales bacterium]|nr:hypothetical protein [Bacteroidales bacterium]